MSSDTPTPPRDPVLRILELVQGGQITPDEASLLLRALDLDTAAAQARSTQAADEQRGGTGPGDMHRPGAHLRREVPGPSRELRRLRREANRMDHEARRVARRQARDAMREARGEVVRVLRLGVEESARAVREVQAELSRAFSGGDGTPPAPGRWLRSLAGLGYGRDRVRHTANVRLVHAAAANERVTVRNLAGDVVVRGWDEPRVEVLGAKTGFGFDREMAQDRAEALPLEIQGRDGEILVEARSPVPAGIGLVNLQRMHTDLEVMVPRHAQLEVSTGGGDVVVADYGGRLSVGTSRGDVKIERAQGIVAVETVSGDIELDADAEEIGLVSVSGDITAELRPWARGQYRLRSAHGDVMVRLRPGAGARCEAETESGDLNLALPLQALVKERHRFVGQVSAREGAAGAPAEAALLSMITISGDITLSE